MEARAATPGNAPFIATIYNQGIEDRIATFETQERTIEDIKAWFDSKHPIAIVEEGDRVIAFAAASAYRPRACYRGVAEASVYVERSFRGRGAGRFALSKLIQLAEAAGYWKLLCAYFRRTAPAARWLHRSDFGK